MFDFTDANSDCSVILECRRFAAVRRKRENGVLPVLAVLLFGVDFCLAFAGGHVTLAFDPAGGVVEIG